MASMRGKPYAPSQKAPSPATRHKSRPPKRGAWQPALPTYNICSFVGRMEVPEVLPGAHRAHGIQPAAGRPLSPRHTIHSGSPQLPPSRWPPWKMFQQGSPPNVHRRNRSRDPLQQNASLGTNPHAKTQPVTEAQRLPLFQLFHPSAPQMEAPLEIHLFFFLLLLGQVFTISRFQKEKSKS